MAFTSLADLNHNPVIVGQMISEAVAVKSAIMSSGAVLASDMLKTFAAQAGSTGDLPHFLNYAWSAPDLAKDDATDATPVNLAGGKQLFQKDFVSKTFGSAALTATISGADIVGQIVNNVLAPYWVQSFQAYTLAKLSGVIKDNIANDGGDMVEDVATDAVGAPAAAELANFNTFVNALDTMGDASEKIKLIIMHSHVYNNLLKLEPTAMLPASQTQPFATYHGMRVIKDDGLVPVAGTNRNTYTTYLLGEGALLFGESEPEMGSINVRQNQDAGNGWGAELVTTRKQFILHVGGMASSATVSANTGSPAITAYDAASAWNRVYNRKNVPIIALKTNG